MASDFIDPRRIYTRHQFKEAAKRRSFVDDLGRIYVLIGVVGERLCDYQVMLPTAKRPRDRSVAEWRAESHHDTPPVEFPLTGEFIAIKGPGAAIIEQGGDPPSNNLTIVVREIVTRKGCTCAYLRVTPLE